MLRNLTHSPNYRWWVFGTIAIGTFMSVVDHGSVLVALPEIESHFGTDLPTVQWIIIGYALAISVLLLPMGRLGDIVGRKQVYIGGSVIFVLAAALAGASPNLYLLIGAKVIQGVGSAMVQGNAMATIITVFSGEDRGKALGSHLSVVGTGAIAGPALGGLLVSAMGWRAVFFVNVPIGLITIVVSSIILTGGVASREARTESRPSFDWAGAFLSACALLALLLAVGNINRLGWDSPEIITGAFCGGLFLALFIWWELRCPAPMLDLRLFRRKLVALGVAAGWIAFLGTSAARFLMPFYLQRVLENSPRDVGLLMIPPALMMVIIGPVSGQLSDRFGWRPFTFSGLALSALAWFILATQLSQDSSITLVITMLMLQGSGTALFNSPNNSSIMSAVERSSYGVMSSLTQLVRNSANVISVAVATAVIVFTMGSMGVEPALDAVSPAVAGAFVAGLHRVFWLMGGLLVAGMVIVLLRGERSESRPLATRRASATNLAEETTTARR